MPFSSFRLRQVVTYFGVILFIALTVLALVHPLVSHDSEWYHLPFSRGLWHIGPMPVVTHDPVVYDRWLGFPKFAEWAQGLFWRVSGWQGAVTLPHLLLFAFYLGMLRCYFRLPLSLLVLALFTCPVLLIHYADTYIDLFSGLCIAIAFFGAMHSLARLARREPLGVRDYLPAATALVMGANTKDQAYLAAMLLLVLVGAQLVFSRRIEPKMKVKATALLALLAISCSTLPIVNAVRFHNPFYPVTVELGNKVLFPGPEGMDHIVPGYSIQMLNARPVAFFLSASEIDWSLRGLPTAYSVDSAFADYPAQGHPARTGGLGGVYFLLWLAVLGLALLRFRRLRGNLLTLCLINCVIFVFVTSLLPQSHMLRYYLYVPLILIPLALKFALVNRTALAAVKIVLVVLLFNHLCHFHLGTGVSWKEPGRAISPGNSGP